jgi:hypothetical protein
MISFFALWGILSCGMAGLSIYCECHRADRIRQRMATANKK